MCRGERTVKVALPAESVTTMVGVTLPRSAGDMERVTVSPEIRLLNLSVTSTVHISELTPSAGSVSDEGMKLNLLDVSGVNVITSVSL